MSNLSNEDWKEWGNMEQTQELLKRFGKVYDALLENSTKAPAGKRDSYVDQAIGVRIASGELEYKMGGNSDE